MKLVSPRKVLTLVAKAVPSECHKNIIIVGSLAVGYQLLRYDASFQVRTKDIDCVLSPRIKAVKSGRAVAEKLLASGWHLRDKGEYGKPGTPSTPDDKLPGVRLYPPNSEGWFLELLTVPESESASGKQWQRVELAVGHYGLPSFQFLSVATFDPVKTDLGIYCAKPEMMALANLLEHPKIRPEVMSSLIENREIKRTNKDLGRVLAIARLSMAANVDALLEWPAVWEEALRSCFPTQWPKFARRVGSGLRILLASPNDLDEAFHTCVYGLLATQGVSLPQLAIAGQRLIQDAIEPLEDRAKRRNDDHGG